MEGQSHPAAAILPRVHAVIRKDKELLAAFFGKAL